MRRVTDLLPMPAGYFKLVLDLVGTTPARREALLEGTGIAPDGVHRLSEVTAGQQLQQIRNAYRLAPSGWGLSLGRHLQSVTHGYLGFGAVSAPTLGEGLALVERFTSVRNPTFASRSERQGPEYCLSFEPRVELLEEELRPLLETFFLAVQAIAETILGRPFDRGRLEIAGRPPHAGLYKEFFHVDVRFDADRSALVLPEEWLELKSPLADPAMYEASVRKLEEQAERLAGSRFVEARVAQLFASGSDAGLPMERVAKLLGVSTRTLIRRLGESGATYRELRDAHRRRRARVLLGTTQLTMGEIAARLGYEDPSNFARACHRWFGCAPGAARQGLQRPQA